MKKDINYRGILELAAMPALQLILGLMMLLNPDGAVAVIFRILGWVLVAVAVALAIAMAGDRQAGTGQVVLALICGIGGAFLVKNPLILAAGTGKIIGLLLILRGGGDLLRVRKSRAAGGSYRVDGLTDILVLAVGIWLLLWPMAPSRLILSVIGFGLVVAAVVKFFSVKKELTALAEPRNPNIIDADE